MKPNMLTTVTAARKKHLCKRSIWKLQAKAAGKVQRIGVFLKENRLFGST